MAGSIHKVHEMINKVGFEFNDAQANKVVKLAMKAGQLAAQNMSAELSVVLSELGEVFNQALAGLGKEQINFADIIKMPDNSTMEKMTSRFVSQFASNINNGITSEIDVGKQLENLIVERDKLLNRQSKLQKGMRRANYLIELPELASTDEVKPFSSDQIKTFGADVDAAALKIQEDFTHIENQLINAKEGTIEYQRILVSAYEAASNLYRMKGYIDQNPQQVKDPFTLSDYSSTNLASITDDLFSNYGKHMFTIEESYYEPQLAQITVRLQEINGLIQQIQQNNPDIINAQATEPGIKTLNEIEEAYTRILNKKKKVGMGGKNIEAALNFDPTKSKGIQTLYDAYVKMPDDSPWEVQYQALLKYVKLYESYLNGSNQTHKNKVTRPGNEFTKLYEQLKPMATNAENMLRNILNMANNLPLVGMGDSDTNFKGKGAAGVGATTEEVNNANKVAEAEAKARADAEAKARAEKEALEAARQAAEVAEKERLAKEEATKAAEAAAAAAERERIAAEEAAKAKKEAGSYTPGSILNNPMFANMFGKSKDDAKEKQAANEGSAKAAEEELNAERQITNELENQQKLLLYRRVEGQVDPNRISNRSIDALYDKNNNPIIQEALEFGFGGFGDGLYSSVSNAASNLIPQIREGAVSFFEFDASGYNLFVNQTMEQAEALRTFLLSLQKFVGAGTLLDVSQLTDISDLSKDQLFEEAQKIFTNFSMTKQQFDAWLDSARQESEAIAKMFANGQVPENRHNFGTRFMQALGYEGVLNNTGDIEYDGNYQGSVIYDPDLDKMKQSLRVFDNEEEFAAHIQATTQAHRENTSAIHDETQAQEHLNDVENQNPHTQDESGAHDANADAIKTKIKSYEELCQVIERLNLLRAKGQNNLTSEEVAEQDAILARLRETKGTTSPDKAVSNALQWNSMIAGSLPINEQKMAQYLGIEIPAAAKQAEGALNGVAGAQEHLNDVENQNPPAKDETGIHNANADALNNETHAQEGLNNAEGQNPVANGQGIVTGGTKGTGTSSAEAGDLETVRAKVAEITDAVNAKTQAFLTEQKTVNDISRSEVSALSEVENKVTIVKDTLDNLQTKQHSINLSIAGSEDISNITTTESDALTKLRAALQLTTKRVNEKTQAFEIEKSVVNTVVNSEINALTRLNTQVDTINQTVLNLLTNLQNVQVTASNIVVPTTQPTPSVNNNSGGGGGGNKTSPQLLDAKIDTQFSSLSLMYAQLESVGKLTPQIEKQWLDLWDSLSQVKDIPSFQLWREQLHQVSNSMKEIMIANDLVEKDGVQSFQRLIAVTKLYNKMIIGAANAKTSEASAAYNQEANTALVEQLMLLKNITLTKEQEAQLDELRAERERQLAIIQAQQTGAANAKQQKQEEAIVVRQLVELYEQLGRARANGDFVSASTIRGQIKAERGKLSTVDRATDDKFAQATARGEKFVAGEENKAATKAHNDALRERQKIFGDLIRLHRELGALEESEKSAALSDSKRNQYKSEIYELYKQISAKEQLIVLTQEEIALLNQTHTNGGRSARISNAGEREAELNKLKGQYVKLGEAQANAEFKGTEEAKTRFTILAKEIAEKKKSLNLTQQELDLLRQIVSNSYQKQGQILMGRQRDSDLKQQIQKAQKQAGTNKAQSAVGRATDTLIQASQIPGISPEQQANIDAYKSKILQLQSTIDNFPKKGIVTEEQKNQLIQQRLALDAYTKEIQEFIAQQERLSGSNAIQTGINMSSVLGTGNDNIQTQLTQQVKAFTNGSAHIQSYNAETQQLSYTMKNASGGITQFTAEINKNNGQLTILEGKTTQAVGVFQTLGNKIKQYSYYFTGSMMIYRMIAWVREGITAVKDIDTALTELKKVTDETEESYDKFLDTAAETASKVGSTIKDVVSSTADWARLGYTIKEAATMAESTQILMNVSEFDDVSKATDTLISAVQAFGYTADESMHVVDILNTIGNNYAISTADLADSLTKSSGSLVAANGTLEEAVALTATANTIIQDSDVVGTALKTVAMRIRGTSVKEMEEEGLETDGVVTQSKLQDKIKALSGVNILTDTGAYKSTYEILYEIADVWESISDVDQAALLELLAGKRSGSVMAAILENPDTLKDAFESASDASGSALKENEKYLDSVQGKMDLFNNALQTMWNNQMNSDTIKWFVELGTTLIEIIDKIGLLGTALAGIAIFGMVSSRTGPIGFLTEIMRLITNVSTKIKLLGTNMAAVFAGDMSPLTNSLSQFVAAQKSVQASTLATKFNTDKLTQSQLLQKISTSGLTGEITTLNAAQMSNALQTANVSREQRLQIIQSLGLGKATKAVSKEQLIRALTSSGVAEADAAAIATSLGLTGATKGLAGAFRTLWTAMWPVLVIMLAIAAVTAIVKIFDAMYESASELSDKLGELRSEIESIESEIDSLNSELETARERMAELEAMPSLSFVEQDELAELKETTAELEKQVKLKKALSDSKQALLEADTENYIDKVWNSTSVDKSYYIDSDGIIHKDEGWNGFWNSGTDTKNALDTAMSRYETYKDIYENYMEVISQWDPDDDAANDALRQKYNITCEYYEGIINQANYYKDLLGDIAEGINMVFADENFEDLEYGMSDDIDKFLDEMYGYQLKWQQAQGYSVKSDAISALFDSTSTETLQRLGRELQAIVDDDSITDKNQAILNKLYGLDGAADAELKVDNLTDSYHRLQIAMNTVGITAQDIADYFVLENGIFNSNTLDGIIAQYEKGADVLEKLKNGEKISYTKEDGSVEQIGWDDLVQNGKADEIQLAKILKGLDNQTREDFGKVIEYVESQRDALGEAFNFETVMNEAIERFNLSGLRAVIEFEKKQLESINIDLFPDLKDEIDGIIDTFGEFIKAVGSAVDAMDALEQAQKEESNSGSVSLETLEKLMNSTSDYADLIEVDETGAIKLVSNAQQLLVQQKINTIKKNAELAESEAKVALEEAKHAVTTSTVSTPAQQGLRTILLEVGGAVAFVSSLYNDLTAGNLDGSWDRAKKAQDNAKADKQAEWDNQAANAVAGLAEAQANYDRAVKMNKIAQGLTPDNIQMRYESDKADGSDDDRLEKLKEKYERKISNLDNQQTYLENEIERLEAENKGVSKSYYEEQIAIEEQKMSLLQQERTELTNLLNATAEGGDTWWEVSEALWEVEHSIQESTLRTIEFRKSIAELYKTAFDKLDEAYGNNDDLYSDRQEYIEKYIELLDLQGKAKPASAYLGLIAEEEAKLANNMAELNDLRQVLAEGVNNGDIEVGSEEWIEMQSSIRETEAAILDNKVAIEQYKEELKELQVEAFELVREAFGNRNDYYGHQQDYIEGYIDYLEATGVDATPEMYEKLIDIEKEKRANNVADLADARIGLAKLEAAGYTAADEEWIDANNSIVELEKGIQDCDIAMAQWAKDIRELEFEKFDYFAGRVSRINDELENVYKLVEDEDVAFDDGTWTKEGITALSTMYHQMENNEKMIDKYGEELAKLEKQYKSGEMSEKDYLERAEELQDAQWDLIHSNEDLKDSIIDINEARIDLVEEGLNEEIDAYQELIELKKEELDAERDLYDFKRDVEKQTKDIAELQRRLSAVSGSDDPADVAERRKLQAQLKEAQDELNYTYYGHSKDSQSQALDDELDAYQKSTEDYIETLREALEITEVMIQETFSDVLLNADITYQNLIEISDIYGVTLSTNLTNPWQQMGDKATEIKNRIGEDLLVLNEDNVVPFSQNAELFLTTPFEQGGSAAESFKTITSTQLDEIQTKVNDTTSDTTREFDAMMANATVSTNTFSSLVESKIDGAVRTAQLKASDMSNALTSPWNDGVTAINTWSTAVANAYTQGITNARNYVTEVNKEYAKIKTPNYTTNATTTTKPATTTTTTTTTKPATTTTTTSSSFPLQRVGTLSKQFIVGSETFFNKNLVTLAGNKYYKQDNGDKTDWYYAASLAKKVKYDGGRSTGMAFPAGISYYRMKAKGTLDNERDEWAITDEPWLGDELVLVPTEKGNLQYMRKGTAVMPADISANLVEWGKINPDTAALTSGIQNVNLMSNYVSKPELNLSFDALLKAESITEETLPAVKKLVTQELDNFARKLNYSLKRTGGI